MRQIGALLLLIFAVSVPGRADQPSFSVFAPASTTDALTEIAAAYEAQGHDRPLLVFGSSATLARQIVHGAPADLYLSANREWVDYLEAEDMLQPSSRRVLFGNRLVIAVSVDSPLRDNEINPLDQLFALGRLAIADPASVPAGRYAKQALSASGHWQAATKHGVFVTDVRVALKWIARGEVAGGITYATDAAIEPRVRAIWMFPLSSHNPIEYEIAQISEHNASKAWHFLQYLESEQAQAVFSRYGFLTAPADAG